MIENADVFDFSMSQEDMDEMVRTAIASQPLVPFLTHLLYIITL